MCQRSGVKFSSHLLRACSKVCLMHRSYVPEIRGLKSSHAHLRTYYNGSLSLAPDQEMSVRFWLPSSVEIHFNLFKLNS